MEYRYLTKLQIAELLLEAKVQKLQLRYHFLERKSSDCMFDLLYDDDYLSTDYDNEMDQILEERFQIREDLDQTKQKLNQVQKERLYELYPSCKPVIESLEKQKTKTYQLTR